MTAQGVPYQAWIGNVPPDMTPPDVGRHLAKHGYGRPTNVYLALGPEGAKWGVVTFRTRKEAAEFRQAGYRHNTLFWPDGKFALIRPACLRKTKGRRLQGAIETDLTAAFSKLHADLMAQSRCISEMYQTFLALCRRGGNAGPGLTLVRGQSSRW